MMKKKHPTKVVNLRVRFPEDVIVAVKSSASQSRRSQNSEIVHLVAEGLGLNVPPQARQAG